MYFLLLITHTKKKVLEKMTQPPFQLEKKDKKCKFSLGSKLSDQIKNRLGPKMLSDGPILEIKRPK